jgi:hypothetical protein
LQAKVNADLVTMTFVIPPGSAAGPMDPFLDSIRILRNGSPVFPSSRSKRSMGFSGFGSRRALIEIHESQIRLNT